MKPETKPFRFAADRKFGVDRNAGVLTGIALITAGVEAKGHGVFIDEQTIATGATVLAERGGRLKCSIRHLSWEEYFDKGGDRIEDFPGFFSGCGAKGKQLVAEKLEFYETFRTGEETQPKFQRLLEMAEKTPDLFGVSLELWGYCVYVAKDGTEYSERPKDVELKYDGLPALRITDMSYGSLVDEPAANPGGLFARLSRKVSDSELVAALRALFVGEQPHTALAAKPFAGAAATPASQNTVTSASSKEAPTEFSAMNELIAKINAKFGAHPAQFSSAMTILGKNPAITFEALEAEMSKQETADLRTQLASLTTEKTNLSAKVTSLEADKVALTAERDEWKKKFTEIKASGHGGEVDLGANTAGASVDDNPWQAGASYSLTRQAELTKSNPALAAQLKAAANKPAAKPAAEKKA